MNISWNWQNSQHSGSECIQGSNTVENSWGEFACVPVSDRSCISAWQPPIVSHQWHRFGVCNSSSSFFGGGGGSLHFAKQTQWQHLHFLSTWKRNPNKQSSLYSFHPSLQGTILYILVYKHHGYLLSPDTGCPFAEHTLHVFKEPLHYRTLTSNLYNPSPK